MPGHAAGKFQQLAVQGSIADCQGLRLSLRPVGNSVDNRLQIFRDRCPARAVTRRLKNRQLAYRGRPEDAETRFEWLHSGYTRRDVGPESTKG
jgi:hypothetical protein